MSLWDSVLGQLTLTLEQAALTPFIRRLHGDVVVWAGAHPGSADVIQRCMVRHSVYLQTGPGMPHEVPGEVSAVSSELQALPFKSNSVDGMVLHHALETTTDPRVALREVTRVLAPGGRVVICGFNPMSMVGVRRLYARMFEDCLSEHRLINPLRLFDWLTLLGFELDIKPQYSGFGLPSRRLLERLDLPLLERRERYPQPPSSLPFGGLLIVSATKQAISGRFQWRSRKERRRLAPVAYPSVSSWQKSES